ncbi:hypothetical protein CTI12_AA519490 [Artemisia annua]|uniref:RING-type domain-containing protein n=1 Tax=Artemisia annua TaxID=35608 RepID=A0A2U1L8B0_ARTAN|nr:hypothetical protein CTI12_AA519490 [Artemisia annua]
MAYEWKFDDLDTYLFNVTADDFDDDINMDIESLLSIFYATQPANSLQNGVVNPSLSIGPCSEPSSYSADEHFETHNDDVVGSFIFSPQDQSGASTSGTVCSADSFESERKMVGFGFTKLDSLLDAVSSPSLCEMGSGSEIVGFSNWDGDHDSSTTQNQPSHFLDTWRPDTQSLDNSCFQFDTSIKKEFIYMKEDIESKVTEINNTYSFTPKNDKQAMVNLDDMCNLEYMSQPDPKKQLQVYGKSIVTAQLALLGAPGTQMGFNSTRLKTNDEQLIYQAALQDLSQPKSEATPPDGALAVPLLRHQRIALSWMVQKETESMHCLGGILADDQLKRTSPGKLKRKKDKRTKDPLELAKYDVVLTTYAIVSMEVPKQLLMDEDFDESKKHNEFHPSDISSTKKRKHSKKGKKEIENQLSEPFDWPLAKVKWFRVVLDEAQSIKNHKTQVAKACWGLKGKRRWCLSGTPIQNAIDDLYSYFRFLRYDPYDTYTSFRSTIKAPIQKNPVNGYKKLQAVLQTIMLRRTKGTLIDGEPIIVLPPKTVTLKKVDFTADEREFYCRLEKESRAQFEEYAAAGTVQQNYVNILLMLLRLRQACDHPLLVRGCSSSSEWKSSFEKAKNLAPDFRKRLLNFLEASLAVCGICNVCTLIDGEPIIVLPPKTVTLKKVDFTADEREFYCRLEAESRAQFEEYAAAGTVQQNYVNILLMLLRLRQACDHPLLVKGCSSSSEWKSSFEKAKNLAPDFRSRLLNCLEASLAVCGICSDPPEDAVVTICEHVFCNQCILEQLTTDDCQCSSATCKALLAPSLVFSRLMLRLAQSDQNDCSSLVKCREGESNSLFTMDEDAGFA